MRINKFFATTVTIFLLLMVSGLAAYLYLGAAAKSERLFGDFKVSVYLSDTLTKERVCAIEQQLNNNPKVSQVQLVSKQEAAKEFEQRFGIEVGEKNPLPVSLRLTMKPKTDVKTFSSEVSRIAGVEEVDYPYAIVQGVEGNLRSINYFAVGFCVILGLVVLIVFRNAVRMDIAASDEAIDEAVARKLPKSYIRQPFLVRAFTQGAIAGGLASVFLFLATDGIATVYPSTKLPIDLSVMFVIFAVMILAAMLLSWVFAYFAVEYQIGISLKKR